MSSKKNKLYRNKNWLYKKYIEEKLSTWKIGKIFGVNAKTIWKWLKKFNIPIRNHSESHKGELNYLWKGGKKKDSDGYFYTYLPSHPHANNMGYVYEHRLIMEKHLGRTLTSKEVVHHINGNIGDNRIENLMLFSCNAEHLKFHKKEKPWKWRR